VFVVVLVLATIFSPARLMLVGGDAVGAAPGAGRAGADFNGDGAEDLAVGVPFESVGSVPFAGAVNVLYGGQPLLAGTRSQLFTQDSPGIGGTAEADDSFGRVLAVGDFDGDGTDDLAVGVEYETVGSVLAAGAVNVIYGSATGLNRGRASQLFTQDSPGIASTVEAHDRFGAALAADDLDGDGIDELVVGGPFEAVGTVPHAGAVNVIYGSATGLNRGRASKLFTQDSPGVADTVEPYDGFGGALTTGDVNGDGVADLAAGSSETVGTVEGAGAVNILFGSPSGLGGAGQLFTQASTGVGSDPETDDQFGSSLGTGDFDGNGYADLAVGVPNESVGAVPAAGVVNVLYGGPGGLSGPGSQLFTQATPGIGSEPEVTEFFGQVTAGDFDGDGNDDLAIGVPYETVGPVQAAGAVNILYGGQPRLSGIGSQLFTQDTAGVGSTVEFEDAFGWTRAAGDFDGDGNDDLAIGAPTETVGTTPAAGALNVLYGGQPRLSGVGSQLFTQDSPGIGSTVETGDQFGAALAAPKR
jgi:hypothetical protein